MSGNFKHCVELLKSNEKNVQREARFVLTTICNNILKCPTDTKFRKIRLSDSNVMNKLLPASGAIECLFEAGFVEEEDGFSLPEDAPLSLLEELKRSIDPALSETLPQKPTNQVQVPSPVKQTLHKPNFFKEIEGHFQNVLRFEDQKLQKRAKLLLPLIELEIKAMEGMRSIQREIKTKSTDSECGSREIAEEDLTVDDLLLPELLRWFKYDFFTWVNSPSCNSCSNECSFVRVLPPPHSGISRVEVHRCGTCGNEVEFPRYTDPGPLLSTRRGRCGEWANVFTLICRSLGYDARLIVDKTDHVWTEVWSVTQKRWIHADPCENTMDQPLMYEKGWGKELSYVIAYSKDEIQDVTWRYTKNPEVVRKRRNFCSEESLTDFILELNKKRLNSLSSSRKQYVIKRSLLELVDMLPAPPGCKKPKEEEENDNYQGRTSGSLAWRLARGETQIKPHQGRKWLIPNGTQNYELRYFVVEDVYRVRIDNKEHETRSGWQEGLDANQGGVFRKEEFDWKMAYLARSPNSEFGAVNWTFEVNDTNLVLSSLKLSAVMETFHSGNIRWEVEKFYSETDTAVEKIAPDCRKNFEIDLKNAVRVSVKAILSGGKDELAWQHAQLFRQSLNFKEEHSMLIAVSLVKR